MCTKTLYDNYTRCALYARVSTTDQNCETQLRELREYISRRGWKIAREYVDTGFSGSKASRPALDRLMADAAQGKFDCIVVYKIDRFGRSVLHLNQQLAALTSYGVRFIATSQSLDTDEKNPTSRVLLQVLASVAEFEREMIRERTLSGIRAAQAAGKVVGRPKRVFRRDEVSRLRDEEGLSWRAIGKKLGIPAMTAVDSYRTSAPCTETVSTGRSDAGGKRKKKSVAA
ncbi:MAG: recombinase family protein [Acidobacteriia bacterium]|nr:recombinase family protein [Terriglobia bacterium]